MPGLIKREIVSQTDTHIEIVETWDLSVPGCPFVAVRLQPFGLDSDAVSATLRHHVPIEYYRGNHSE